MPGRSASAAADACLSSYWPFILRWNGTAWEAGAKRDPERQHQPVGCGSDLREQRVGGRHYRYRQDPDRALERHGLEAELTRAGIGVYQSGSGLRHTST